MVCYKVTSTVEGEKEGGRAPGGKGGGQKAEVGCGQGDLGQAGEKEVGCERKLRGDL